MPQENIIDRQISENYQEQPNTGETNILDRAKIEVEQLKNGIGDKGGVTHMKDVNIEKLQPDDYDAFANTFLSDKWQSNCSELSNYHQKIQQYLQVKLAIDPGYDTFNDSRDIFYCMIKNRLDSKKADIIHEIKEQNKKNNIKNK